MAQLQLIFEAAGQPQKWIFRSVHARGKRPCNGNQFFEQQKKHHFSLGEKWCFWFLSQPLYFISLINGKLLHLLLE